MRRMHGGATSDRTTGKSLRVERALASALAIWVVMLVGAASANAAATIDGEFAVSSVGTNNEIAPGPDGNMWVTLDGAANDLAMITPAGVVQEFNPIAVTNPVGITTGPDGNMWVTQTNGVASFSPAAPNAAVFTAVAGITDPRGITTGPDGNLWTASGANVVKFPPADPTLFTAYTVLGGARDITAGSDGLLWAADFGNHQIVSVTTAGAPTAYDVGATGGPQGIISGPNGQIAYTDPTVAPQEVGRLSAGGTPLKTQTPLADPFGVAFGTDGAYWIANFASNDLGRLTTDGAYTTLPGFSAGSGPRRIAAGPSNTLWVTLDTANAVARVSGVDPPADPLPDPPPPLVAPTTTLDKSPGKRVETNGRRAKVKFGFSSPATGATFECSLNRRLAKGPAKRRAAKYKPCSSPRKYRLKPGRYGFKVRAASDGLIGKAEKAKFRVVSG